MRFRFKYKDNVQDYAFRSLEDLIYDIISAEKYLRWNESISIYADSATLICLICEISYRKNKRISADLVNDIMNVMKTKEKLGILSISYDGSLSLDAMYYEGNPYPKISYSILNYIYDTECKSNVIEAMEKYNMNTLCFCLTKDMECD